MLSQLDLNKIREDYSTYITNLEIPQTLKSEFIKLLAEPNLKKREELWDAILQKKFPNKELSKLANTFFIGYGNPKSKTLILGKEKGFDIDEQHKLFLKESINNIIHWEKIKENPTVELGKFTPKFPNKFFGKKKQNHTWAKYANIITQSGVSDSLEYPKSFTEKCKVEDSFFSECFISEINHLPSKYSPGSPRKNSGFNERQEFLRKQIIPNFDVVIVAAKTYFSKSEKKREDQIKFLFSDKVKWISGGDLDIKKERLPFWEYEIPETKKKIIFTNQLSGGATWSELGLITLAEKVRSYLE